MSAQSTVAATFTCATSISVESGQVRMQSFTVVRYQSCWCTVTRAPHTWPGVPEVPMT